MSSAASIRPMQLSNSSTAEIRFASMSTFTSVASRSQLGAQSYAPSLYYRSLILQWLAIYAMARWHDGKAEEAR